MTVKAAAPRALDLAFRARLMAAYEVKVMVGKEEVA